MGTGELSGKPDEMLGDNLRLTNIPSRRSSNFTSRLMPLGSCADFTFSLLGLGGKHPNHR